jgi:sister-chromatid-cohesion protein PDS5
MPPSADTSSAAAFASAASGLLKLSKKAELVQRLSELHSALAGLSQEVRDRPKQLGAIAAQLISDKLLGSGDKDVRILTLTCLVDVLRVYAPEAPYSEEELCSIFQAINRELRGLATCDMTSVSGSRLLYVLRSLATVKSCVVVVFLTQNNVRGSNEVFNDLFEVLVSSIRPEHSEEVALYVSTIMHECLEEAQDVRPEVLQLLLTALLPASKAENVAAYRVCQHVLKQASAAVQGAVGDALNRILVGASSGLGDQLTSELDEHIYSLIYEVHKISTGLLLRILPNICVHLQSEEIDIRLKAVKLLGRLFYSPHAEYGEDFSRNFKDYLGRFVDVSAEVRLEMVVSGGLIMKRKPHLRRMAEACLVKRLRDGEWEIRQAALSNLCDVAMESAAYLDEETYRELAERMKDRRPSIRRSAMTLLARVYSRHVSGSLPSIEDFMANDALMAKGTFGVSTDTCRSLRIVPGYIIACWGYPEFTDRQLVIQLVQEYLLPK